MSDQLTTIIVCSMIAICYLVTMFLNYHRDKQKHKISEELKMYSREIKNELQKINLTTDIILKYIKSIKNND